MVIKNPRGDKTSPFNLIQPGTPVDKPSPFVLVKPENVRVTSANDVFAELSPLVLGETGFPSTWSLEDSTSNRQLPTPKTLDELRDVAAEVRKHTSCFSCGLKCWDCQGCGTGDGHSIGEKH